MPQFVFDVKLVGEISIFDDNADLAEKRLEVIIEEIGLIIDSQLTNSSGPLLSADIYIDDAGGPLLLSIDGVDVEDMDDDD